jgi:hypothetical protein
MRGLAWGAAMVSVVGSLGASGPVFAKHPRHRHYHHESVPQSSTSTTSAPSITPSLTPPAAVRPADTTPADQSNTAKPSAVVVPTQDAQAVLGKNVRSSAGEDMGHLIDIIVGRDGKPRAAIIDFGGFLGVGSRKIAVDWQALHFSPDDPKGNMITLALTRDQVKAAPEYKEGSPVVVLSASGSLQAMPLTGPRAQEK